MNTISSNVTKLIVGDTTRVATSGIPIFVSTGKGAPVAATFLNYIQLFTKQFRINSTNLTTMQAQRITRNHTSAYLKQRESSISVISIHYDSTAGRLMLT